MNHPGSQVAGWEPSAWKQSRTQRNWPRKKTSKPHLGKKIFILVSPYCKSSEKWCKNSNHDKKASWLIIFCFEMFWVHLSHGLLNLMQQIKYFWKRSSIHLRAKWSIPIPSRVNLWIGSNLLNLQHGFRLWQKCLNPRTQPPPIVWRRVSGCISSRKSQLLLSNSQVPMPYQEPAVRVACACCSKWFETGDAFPVYS